MARFVVVYQLSVVRTQSRAVVSAAVSMRVLHNWSDDPSVVSILFANVDKEQKTDGSDQAVTGKHFQSVFDRFITHILYKGNIL